MTCVGAGEKVSSSVVIRAAAPIAPHRPPIEAGLFGSRIAASPIDASTRPPV